MSSNTPLSFASDNCAGVHPEVLAALTAANEGHVPAYGADPWTERATSIFRKHFGDPIEVFFAFNGSGANVLALQAMTRPFEAVLCSRSAHIAVDECGAPERFTGCKLLTVPHHLGKIQIEDLEQQLARVGDQHHVQPRVISISQTTELGTVYTAEEVRKISDFAKKHGLFLHMDGARISNAAVSLGQPFARFTRDAGVDILSFGGTKAGLLAAEAVVFFNTSLARDFKFVRKQSLQLASKMRFISAQLSALLEGDLWQRTSAHAHRLAKLLESEIRNVPGITLKAPVEANALFVELSKNFIEKLQKEFLFYVWEGGTTHDQVRWMMAWDTREDDVRHFARRIRELAGN
jgi:threonine aldolase